MPDATPTLTSADMIAMLRRHYLPEGRPPGGVFAPEIQSPCGARRADLIWLSTTIAGGRHMIGHEVKVSRSDVMVELRDPSKADPWAQYCNEWWLVVSDPDLVAGLDIPENWGIMSPPSGRRTRSMTVVRKAPKLTPSLAANGVARVTAWLNQRYVELQYQSERELLYQKGATERAERTIRELRDGGAASQSPHAKRITDLTLRVEKGLREKKNWMARASDDDIVQALIDLATIRAHYREFARALQGMRLDVDAMGKILAKMPEVSPDDELPFGGAA